MRFNPYKTGSGEDIDSRITLYETETKNIALTVVLN
jgi:hypothetical protein